ncbi:MAG TPA: hypothetical protein VEB41_02240 [Burkholderiales bacterium]|nr:hypothetical protein [Burkholderiales bacterium]
MPQIAAALGVAGLVEELQHFDRQVAAEGGSVAELRGRESGRPVQLPREGDHALDRSGREEAVAGHAHGESGEGSAQQERLDVLRRQSERLGELEHARGLRAVRFEQRRDLFPQRLLGGRQRDAMAGKADVCAPALERAGGERVLERGIEERPAVFERKGGSQRGKGLARLFWKVAMMTPHGC